MYDKGSYYGQCPAFRCHFVGGLLAHKFVNKLNHEWFNWSKFVSSSPRQCLEKWWLAVGGKHPLRLNRGSLIQMNAFEKCHLKSVEHFCLGFDVLMLIDTCDEIGWMQFVSFVLFFNITPLHPCWIYLNTACRSRCCAFFLANVWLYSIQYKGQHMNIETNDYHCQLFTFFYKYQII